ncbi:MAG: UDP-N-acetylmuramate dehydrogenase [Akkermansiaceae bacterium]|nr:UDP-N-acetylmuramate dehydrogenase [Armatimonadota bacterium]
MSLLSTEITRLLPMESVRENEPMARHTTLRVGGPARYFYPADDIDVLARVLPALSDAGVPYLFIGHGSNLLMSDRGFDGVVIQNRCKKTIISGETGAVHAECGASLGSLFMQTQRAGLAGLEWGIGIPGTVGGALVSNAGAYRGNIGPLVRQVRAFFEGTVSSFGPEWFGFSYRDSRLRNETPPRTVVLSAEMQLTPAADPGAVLTAAKLYQSERRTKQPFQPSAGSFFKNVQSRELAERFDDLAPALKEAGVVPTGFLSMKAGCMGWREGGAMVSEKHGNFLVNAGNATASDFRRLADRMKARILDAYGVTLEEEVLAVGDWRAEHVQMPKKIGTESNV